ncbi:MAG: 30S ribosomal protein S8 [SAR86 cluster bacterium]|jgi:small subunit ribosomal protein S8|nr:30S ribosomal protein S8 [Gammaproteobacteria bacterium]MDG2456988.1 30S ribosomal protein S8 [SAR86 cluster bacterium]|tara:strand:- start:226 stop:618 length:393 start_codon:yes stop_codon:yes gene_type:complete
MTIQDPIANLFSSINNAQSRLKESVVVPSSTKKVALVEILKKEGYLGAYSVSEETKPLLTIKLRYFEGLPVIKQLKRLSRPGLREYSGFKDLPSVNGGLGVAIISTNKGLMTDQEAREAELGGEVICSVF